MYDDQQRRLDALHRLAQEQLRAQKHDEDLELVVEPLTPGIATSNRMRRSGARRGLLAALISGLTLLGLVVTGSFNWRRFLPAPTPTATPITGNELIVTSNANFGSVTLNGKAVSGAFPLLVRLNPGENTITFSASPFRDQICIVTLLTQADVRSGQRVQPSGARCVTGNQEPPLSLNGIAVKNGYLNFSLTGADLPDAARSAAESALWAKLASPPTFQIPAGDYYATGVDTSGRIRSARAAVSLLAAPALARASATQNGAYYCSNLGCPGEPVLPDQADASTPAGVWLARESVALGWRFTTRSGAPVATSPARDGLEVEVGLTYSPTAGWGVTDGAPRPFIGDLQTQLISASCQSGSTVLQALVDKSSLAREQLASGERRVGGPTPAQTDGCALKLESMNDNPLSPSKEYGHYVWRWGVLLAADTQAHALFPTLPVAPQSEIDAVGGIAF